MQLDEHSCQLGGPLANFQSLEFILRAYLQKHSDTNNYYITRNRFLLFSSWN